MTPDDFDEDTLEDIVSGKRFPHESVIGPIAEMRRKKEIQENTFAISRENYENSTDEQVEAWFTKFDQVVIDDSANPYKDPLTKKELAIKIISKVNFENFDKGITKFNSGMAQFSKMVEDPNKGKKSKKKSFQFGISQKDYDSVFGSKKVKFF